MCVVVHVWEATRVVGHYTMAVPADSSCAGRVAATDVGWRLRVVLAGGVWVRGVGCASSGVRWGRGF